MQHLEEGTIHAWLDGALGATDAREAELHVATCATCAGAVAEARGLIAASSIILSKLDDADGDRTATAARSQRATRSVGRGAGYWLQDARVRAAAALLILAGGAAAVGGVAGGNDVARMVDGFTVESSVLAGEEALVPASETGMTAAGDATAAAIAQPAQVAAPPTVKPASPLARPEVAAGVVRAASSVRPPGTGGEQGERLRDGQLRGGSASGAPSASPPPASDFGMLRAEERVAIQKEAAGAQAAAVPSAAVPTAAAASAAVPSATVLTAVPSAAVPSGAVPSATVPGRQAEPAAGRSPILLRDTLVAGLGLERRRLAETPRAQLSSAREAPVSSGAPAAVAPRCYTLDLSPWSPAGTVSPVALPSRILLAPDSGLAGPAKGQRLVRPAGEGELDDHVTAWWTEVSPSTLVLTWMAGREGIVMRLAGAGDALYGTARTFGPGGGAERTSVVTLQRLDCDDGR